MKRTGRVRTAFDESESTNKRRSRCVQDARGRWVQPFEPVRAYLLNHFETIEADALDAIVHQLLPGARRKRLLQALSVVLGFALVIGGNLIYFRYFSRWKGLDPVNTFLYVLQLVVLLSGPVLAFRMVQRTYAGRVVKTLLEHARCAHCGYDLRGLPIDTTDGATICPECGCAWRIDSAVCH